MDLRRKRVLVTGASRGIGAEIAHRVAERGAHVIAVARTREPLEKLASLVGGTAIAADLADFSQLDGLFDRAEADGPVDVLINNAGLGMAAGIAAMDPGHARRLYDVNLVAPTELCRQAAVRMLARGSGRIVNVSSMAAAAAGPGMSVYAASKAGLSHFTEGLRLDLRGSGVGVTLVEIGPVSTEMMEDFDDHPPTRALMDRLHRVRALRDLRPEEVAEAIVRAIVDDRRVVRLPGLASVLHAFPSFPRRMTELLLAGIPSRPDHAP